jgi:hypothetical protein
VRTLRIGEEVLDREGHRLGSVERLVVDEKAHRITHLVVDGHLLGLDRVSEAGPERLRADLARSDLERLPEVHEGVVVPAGEHWRPPAGYQLGNYLRIAEAIIGGSPYVPPVAADLELEETPEIKAGSPVWSGQRQLGKVTRAVADPDGTLRELVVRHDLLDGERRVPADRVTEVVGTNVHVDLTDQEFEALPRPA